MFEIILTQHNFQVVHTRTNNGQWSKITSAIYAITSRAFMGEGKKKKKETNQLQSNDRISIITWAKIRVIYQQNLGEMQIIVYCAGETKRGGDGMAEFSFVFNK